MAYHKPYAPLHTTANARNLRTNSTDTEQKIWNLLRSRQFQDIKFRRQHPIGKYIADFVSIQHKLVIELDGGQHTQDKNCEYDRIRTEFLKQQGWLVLRFWNNDVLENIEGISQALTLSQRERELNGDTYEKA